MSSKHKTRNQRKAFNLNIGMLIFLAIFIYVLISIVMYFQTKHIVRYEVREGSLVSNNTYTGIAIRDEVTVNTEFAGYINFYVYEGERVGVHNLVYTIDETGRLNEYLDHVPIGENSLSDKELAEFRSDIVNFVHSYTPTNYEHTYDFKRTLKNTLMKLNNSNMMQRINELSDFTGGGNIVNFCDASETGIVAHWVDGYEDLTVQDITPDLFNQKAYEKEQKKTADH